jgi:HSP20 family protein
MTKQKTKELVRVEPSKVFSHFHNMDRWFEGFFRRPFSLFPTWWHRVRMPEIEEVSPTVDIYEENSDVVVKAELPGIKKEDIDVSLNDDILTISGEKKKEEKVEKKDYCTIERSYGSFSRSFRLPSEVKTDKADAKFKDGVLEIKIPMTVESKKKKIKVSVQ